MTDSLPKKVRFVEVKPGSAAAQAMPRIGNAFYEFEVERAVERAPGNTAAAYPAGLRTSGVEGTVVARFVVDAAGVADMNTYEVIKSTHELFAESVRQHLPNMRFIPAVNDGIAVAQVVSMPFVFRLSR